ncbi:MAG TPA: methyltransferase domain-containing protein [Solirubrobacterales bacterium]|jgi:ubiquinone/menaquinone biosynthesis C-methylase UbiE|nr:methyltransferase domain-containing protein [Solirubrobacterales bacterium]
MRIRTAIGLTGAAVAGAALWWRKNPSACPYGQRFWVEAPHPIITRDRLRSVLRPEPGERILEIGPGVGYYTLDMADWVGPEGRLEVFDLQQEFLDHTTARATERGLTNVVPTQGDATALPYEDKAMDAVVLTAVLGEIPDPVAALCQINRVLKPSGRLVVGELFGDPHFTTQAALRSQALEAGLAWEHHSGNWFGFFARLSCA